MTSPRPPHSTNSPPALHRIDRFYIVREIGRGGLGVVHLARDPVIDRNVAIKTLSPRLSAVEKKQAETRFVNEARAVGGLAHPNIVTIYDANIESDPAYLIMEYLEGSELSRMLDSGRIFPPSEIASIVRKLADALAYAHRQGVIHRDIKPGNVFILAGNQPKIFDFGIAQVLNRVSSTAGLPDGPTLEDDTTTSLHDNLAGTPNYMSPEQAAGRPVNNLTDIYSLGAVMYEMLAHRRPFQYDTTEEVLDAIANRTPPAPHQLNKAIAPVLSQIAMKAMSKQPQERYQSGEEMALDLGRYLALHKRVRSKVSAARSEEDDDLPALPTRLPQFALAGLLAAAAGAAYFWLRMKGLA
ncbi:MAG: serine/threonine protein kinase [Burkholderiaceae bacterium]|nr:serine/threonine protein kinase [Burkholderiaceae bacterium]